MSLLNKIESEKNATEKRITKKMLEALLVEKTAELKKLREEGEAANNTKGVFLTNINHEIRTPLNGIIGMLQLLNMTELSDEQKAYLEVIKSSSDDLLKIINNLLEITRIQTGMAKIVDEHFSIEETVYEVVAFFRNNIKDKEIELTSSISEKIPLKVYGDKHCIRQILDNLVGNAVKFTYHGKIDLNVELEDTMDGACTSSLKFTISDTGIGIEKNKLAFVFDSFMQGEYIKIKNYGGVGLGLAISKGLADLMNGKITVESRVGEGSTFICRIPCIIK